MTFAKKNFQHISLGIDKIWISLKIHYFPVKYVLEEQNWEKLCCIQLPEYVIPPPAPTAPAPEPKKRALWC